MMENLIWNFRINKILSSEKIKIQAGPNERLGLKHNDRFWLKNIMTDCALSCNRSFFSYVIECYFGIFLAASILRKMKRRIVNPHSDDPP